MMKIGIIGAGPAGLHLARMLSIQKIETTLFDRIRVREKPCAGGVTFRVMREFDDLRAMEDKWKRIDSVVITSPSDLVAELHLKEPIIIFSRRDLDSFLKARAMDAGAAVVNERVIDFIQDEKGWSILTEKSTYRGFDFLVGADGASGLSRKKLSRPFQESELTQTVGFYIKNSTEDCIRIKFYEDIEGYAWSFPGKNEINVGIGAHLGKKNPKELLDLVNHFLNRYLPDFRRNAKEFFSALIPFANPDVENLRRISGKQWALIGDSSGITDPITREGIYYAMKTAALLGDALKAGEAWRYPQTVEECFAKDLSWADRNWNRFFRKGFIDSAVEACNRDPEISSVIAELFSATLPYRDLLTRLMALSLKTDFTLLRKLVSHLL
ncbi:MAG: NAD(P)/FAD-dependent oxidoreductase [Acidobacteriota bacterium]